MADVLIALGGNVGDVRATFQKAIANICGMTQGALLAPSCWCRWWKSRRSVSSPDAALGQRWNSYRPGASNGCPTSADPIKTTVWLGGGGGGVLGARRHPHGR